MDCSGKTQRISGGSTTEGATPDARLVQAVRQGDKRAFVEIVARYQAMVCGIALGILGDVAASEDAGQEAFLIAWQKFNTLNDPARLRSWLGTIARNAALGHLRRNPIHANLDEMPELPDDSPGPDEMAATEEEAEVVRRTLATLPKTYRVPLVLYYRESQSVRTVAETLELSEDAVKQRLARGRALLRDRMSAMIETALTRTGPTSVFTMAVASAIGALAAPSAVAAGVFGAASSTTATSTTNILTAMSASKLLLGTAAAVAIVCMPIGYHLDSQTAPERAPTTPPPFQAISDPVPSQAQPRFENSALIAEWMALLEQYGSTAESMPILHQVIATLNDPFRRRAFHTALIAEWVQVDPVGGSAFFFAEGSDAGQRRQLFEEWLEQDPRAAVDALLVGRTGWERLARDLLPGIAGKMPWRVAEISSRLPEEPDPFGEPKVKDAFVILARSDLANAVREAGKVTGPNRDQALAGVAQVWAKADFHGAIEWARGLPDGTDRDEIIRAALLGKAAVDPIGALESADLVPAGGRRHHFASTTGARVLVEAAKMDFDTTIAWLAQHPERFRQADLLDGLSQPVTERLLSDPAGFLTEYQLNGSLGILVPAIGSALLNQASGQRQAIWDWLQLQWDGEPVRELTREVLMSAGFHDPTRAMRWVDDLPVSAEADPLVALIATSVLNGGWQLHRLDHFLEAAPERLRVPLIESAFKFLGPKVLDDPQRWIARLPLLPEDARDAGIERLAKVWSMQAPEEALGWAATLASGEPRNQALAVITANWAEMDPYHAAEWVGSLPQGTERDRSAGALVDATAERFPDEAWAWASSIEDSDGRSRAAAHVVNVVGARDPQTARAWIAQGPFSPETRESLYASLEGKIESSKAP